MLAPKSKSNVLSSFLNQSSRNNNQGERLRPTFEGPVDGGYSQKTHLIPSLKTSRSSKKWMISSFKDSPSPPKVSEESRPQQIFVAPNVDEIRKWRTKAVGGFVPARNVRCLYGYFRKGRRCLFHVLVELVETRVYPEWGKPGCQAQARSVDLLLHLPKKGCWWRKLENPFCGLFSTGKVKIGGPWIEVSLWIAREGEMVWLSGG